MQIEQLTTPAWHNPKMRWHPLQHKLYTTRARFPVVVAGRGSGKTNISRKKIVRMLPVRKPWADPLYFYGLPTYGQAKRMAWEQLIALIPPDWLKGQPNKTEMCIETIFGSKLYVVGLDKPYRIEGNQWDGGILDECSDQRPEAYTKSILPMLTERNGFCWRIGVPKRNGIGGKAFKEGFDKGLLPNDIGLESYTWDSRSVWTEEELRMQKAQMSDKDADEQFGGIWVESEGQIFYAYSDTHNVSAAAIYRPEWRIGVGSDFNVNPMAWVLFHYQGKVMTVFDEIWLRDTNTQAALNELHRRYPTHRGWNFYGDASSRARHASAVVTDFAQIKNDGRFIDSVVHYPKANPAVQDRFAATNALCKNAVGHRRLFINPKCENLRNDLLSRTYKEGSREPDDEGDLGHITDALGYPIYAIAPIVVETEGGNVTITGRSV